MSDNPLFDGEGIEAEHLLLGGALLGHYGTNKKLKETNKKLEDLKKELQKQPPKGPVCPYCSINLPIEICKINFPKCPHCSRKVYWKNGKRQALTTAEIHALGKKDWRAEAEEKNKSARKITADQTVSSVLSKILDEIKSNESIKAGVDITSETLPADIWDKDWFYHMNWMIQRVFGIKLTKEQTNIKLGALAELIFREAGGSCDTDLHKSPSQESNNERDKKESTITFMCSNNHRVTVPVKFAGKSGRCSKCKVRIVVPEDPADDDQ